MPCEVLKIPLCISPRGVSLPPLLGNLTNVILRCWGCTLHHPLQQILSHAPRKDLHPAACITTLSQAYCCVSKGFLKAGPCRVPSHSRREPTWMPQPAAAISARHRLPLAMPLAAPGSTPSPALRTGKPGLGYSSGPPIYQLLMFQQKWFMVFPFPQSAIDWMTSRHEVFPLQEGFILQDRSKMVKSCTGKYIVHFHRERI